MPHPLLEPFRAIGMHGYVVRPVEPTAAALCTDATTNALQFITLSLTTGYLEIKLSGKPDLVIWEATECSLEPVFRSFQAAVHNGVYTDETIAVSAERTVDTTTISTEWHLSPPANLAPLARSAPSYPLPLLDGLAAERAIARFLGALMTGYHWRSATHEGYEVGLPDEVVHVSLSALMAVDPGMPGGCGGLVVGGLENCMQNVGRAVTKTVRDGGVGLGSGGMAMGMVKADIVAVSVRWKWFAVPVVIWILAAVAGMQGFRELRSKQLVPFDLYE